MAEFSEKEKREIAQLQAEVNYHRRHRKPFRPEKQEPDVLRQINYPLHYRLVVGFSLLAKGGSYEFEPRRRKRGR